MILGFEIILLHYFICFLESSISTGSKTALQHYTTTTTVLDERSGFLGVKGPTFSKHIAAHCGQTTHFCFIWPQSFPAKGFFFVHGISSKLQPRFKLPCLEWGLLSFHAKHAWLWTLTLVFQQLLIHCRISFWLFLHLGHALYKQLFAQMFLAPVTALNGSNWLSGHVKINNELFQIKAGLLKSNGCIKQALFKWSQKKEVKS